MWRAATRARTWTSRCPLTRRRSRPPEAATPPAAGPGSRAHHRHDDQDQGYDGYAAEEDQTVVLHAASLRRAQLAPEVRKQGGNAIHEPVEGLTVEDAHCVRDADDRLIDEPHVELVDVVAAGQERIDRPIPRARLGPGRPGAVHHPCHARGPRRGPGAARRQAHV